MNYNQLFSSFQGQQIMVALIGGAASGILKGYQDPLPSDRMESVDAVGVDEMLVARWQN